MSDYHSIPSLAKTYEGYFPIGAAINIQSIEEEGEILKYHYNSITLENHMKFENLQSKLGEFTFQKADQMVEFAKKHKMMVRGHTLVWHNQTPDWVFIEKKGNFVSRDTLLKTMKNHITQVMEHYKDTIHHWDVVNEAIADEEKIFLRESKWLDIIGEDFIEKAFEMAHDVDPNALLFYNDYNESDPIKREKIYRLVKKLVDKNVPIHGVGMQAHWNIHGPGLADIRTAIERYASLGLTIHITEMDVSCFQFGDQRTDLLNQTDEMMSLQAERYHKMFSLFREYRDVISNVTFWGVTDYYTWLNNFPVKGRKNWPLLFDKNQQPKSSFWKVIKF